MTTRERQAIDAHRLHHPDHLHTWMNGNEMNSLIGCDDCGWWAWFPR